MSINFLKYNQLYALLREAIDFEKATPVELKTGVESNFKVEDIAVGIKVEKYPSEGKLYFRPGTSLYSDFSSDTYYNFGFDVEGSTSRVQEEDYKVFVSIIGVAIKSLLNWIEKNNAEVITLIPDDDDKNLKLKKLHVYGAILKGKKSSLQNIGYGWDFYNFTSGKGIYIKKIK